MNLLEQYIQPGYTTKLLKGQDSPVKGVVFVQFDGKVDCYGNHAQHHVSPEVLKMLVGGEG